MKKIHHVTVFVSQNAPLCTTTLGYFRENGIEPEVLDITHNPQARILMMEKSGQKTTPVVEIDGRVVIGFHPELFETILFQK